MSFHTEGAKGVDRKEARSAPEGRNEVARALYLSMVHEAFVLSAGSSARGGRDRHLANVDDPAVRASASEGGRGSPSQGAPAAASVNYPGAVITDMHERPSR